MTATRRHDVLARASGLLPAAAVLLTTLWAFWPVLDGGFVNWDDDKNFLENPHYRGLGRTQLAWMFTAFVSGHYHPLTWLSLAADYAVWGMNPFGYHLTSLLLHAAAAGLFFLAARELLERAAGGSGWGWPAAFAALLFAVHPLRVESVAWLSERRDLLSGALYLLTVLLYLRAQRPSSGPSAARLLPALAVYALALLSKVSVVCLPLTLAILDVYPLRRFSRAALLEKLPFCVLAAAALAPGLLAQERIGAVVSVSRYGLWEGLGMTFYGVAFYLWKSILPVGLLPLYELPRHAGAYTARYVAGALAAAGLTWLFAAKRGRWPAGLAAWACYLAGLLPVSRILQSGPQLVADRYSYLSCMGWAVLGGYLLRGARPAPRAPAILAAAAIVGALGLATRAQSAIWKDSASLWTHALRHAPDSYMAHNNLGMEYDGRGRKDEAFSHFAAAVEANPDFRRARLNLGAALWERGRREEAVAHFRAALALPADGGSAEDGLSARAENNVGSYLWTRGRAGEAAERFQAALRLDPRLGEAHNNLGVYLLSRGRPEEAADSFRAAVRFSPELAAARSNLAVALSRGRRPR